MRTRELLTLRNTGHPGVNALFAKAHSAGWDIENDVDWTQSMASDDPLVHPDWNAFGQTPTFRSLPEAVQVRVTRRGLGRILNILQVGESVAQDVCAKLALLVREEDYRNHAVAQAMDEARHHLAYCRLIERMNEPVEEIDVGTEMMFDSLLAANDPLELVASEQFFLESFAMAIFESLVQYARHPLLQRVVSLITRDESRHIGFGVLYVGEWMRQQPLETQIRFARRWLGQILGAVGDRPGPLMLSRLIERLRDAGVTNPEALAPRLLQEQQEINAADDRAVLSGRRLPHLLKNARHAGLLKPEIVAALGLQNHPLVRVTLQQATADESAVVA